MGNYTSKENGDIDVTLNFLTKVDSKLTDLKTEVKLLFCKASTQPVKQEELKPDPHLTSLINCSDFSSLLTQLQVLNRTIATLTNGFLTTPDRTVEHLKELHDKSIGPRDEWEQLANDTLFNCETLGKQRNWFNEYYEYFNTVKHHTVSQIEVDFNTFIVVFTRFRRILFMYVVEYEKIAEQCQ